MASMNLIETAVAHLGGLTPFTKALNERIGKTLSYQAVKKWIEKGRLPRTEWTGETHYAEAIESLTGGLVQRADLLKIDGAMTDATEEAR